MKNFLKSFSRLFYASALTILLVTASLTSCDKNEVAPTPSTPATPETSQEFKGLELKSTTSISATDPLISSLKLTDDIVNFNSSLGTLDWNSATLATYEGVDMQAILVPISKSRTLIAYSNPETKAFKVMILEIAADLSKMKENE